MARILSAPCISFWILCHEYDWAWFGCVLSGLSDVLDGYVARKLGQTTVLGTYLDPLADKCVINCVSVSLWCCSDTLPAALVLLFLAKDTLLVLATYRHVRSNTPGAVMNPSTTPLRVEPNLISKVNTGLQFVTITAALTQLLHHDILPPPVVFDSLCWLTGGTTLASVLSYLRYDAFRPSGNK